jgi:hypothetical protein
MADITNTGLAWSVTKENSPASFVEVPLPVPLISTDAPTTALPFSSVTLPEIVLFCAKSCEQITSIPSITQRSLLMFVKGLNKIITGKPSEWIPDVFEENVVSQVKQSRNWILVSQSV